MYSTSSLIDFTFNVKNFPAITKIFIIFKGNITIVIYLQNYINKRQILLVDNKFYFYLNICSTRSNKLVTELGVS